MLTFSAPSRAAEPLKPAADAPPMWREVWAGVDATASGWLVFSGITIAPMSQIHGEGVRFRLATGYGGYTYDGLRGAAAYNRALGREERRALQQSFDAQTGFADILAGYLWRLDPLILKAFVGVSGTDHAIQPFDPENLAIGLDWGPKAVVEMWLNVGDDMWASVDLSWSGAHDTGSARGRFGYRVTKQVSLGPELRFDIDSQGECDIRWVETESCKAQYRNRFGSPAEVFDYSRGGLFVRYEWSGGEISAAAGVSGRVLGQAGEGEDPDPYGSISWITQW